MRTRMFLVAGVVVIAVLHSASVEAQKNALPKGRPFQMLREAVNQSQATLLQQIESLQAQVDANTANDQVQTQLIAAMQTLASQMESTLATTQASVDTLMAYNTLQAQLLQQQMAQAATLQAQMTGDLSQLFALYQAQQAALTTLTTQLNFLTSQGQAQQTDLASLAAQLNALKIEYEQTSAKLASGCPLNSSIRQLTPTTVTCEADSTSGALLQGAEFVGNSVTIPPGATLNADAFCGPSSPSYTASGGGVSATLGVTLVQSVRLQTNGWRVVVQNPNASNVQVQARVSCIRVN